MLIKRRAGTLVRPYPWPASPDCGGITPPRPPQAARERPARIATHAVTALRARPGAFILYYLVKQTGVGETTRTRSAGRRSSFRPTNKQLRYLGRGLIPRRRSSAKSGRPCPGPTRGAANAMAWHLVPLVVLARPRSSRLPYVPSLTRAPQRPRNMYA